jgi:hypothetical protein
MYKKLAIAKLSVVANTLSRNGLKGNLFLLIDSVATQKQ